MGNLKKHKIIAIGFVILQYSLCNILISLNLPSLTLNATYFGEDGWESDSDV